MKSLTQYIVIFEFNACISDAGHEAQYHANETIGNKKSLQSQIDTAGLHSLHTVVRFCYYVPQLLLLFLCRVLLHNTGQLQQPHLTGNLYRQQVRPCRLQEALL